jgi:hypothetical protein
LRDVLQELQVEVETLKRDITGLKEIQASFQCCEKLDINFKNTITKSAKIALFVLLVCCYCYFGGGGGPGDSTAASEISSSAENMASEAGVHFAGFFTNIAVNIVSNPSLGTFSIFLAHGENKFLLFSFLSPF